MTLRTIGALAFACALLGVVTPASAQAVEDPFEAARFRFGPVRFTPLLEITGVGRDSNVFNEAEDPKSDTTAAVGPAVELWMRPGRTRLSGRVGGQYLYFREFQNQRAWNTDNRVKWEFLLARFTPFVGGSFVNSKDRQGYEIDSRSPRRDVSGNVGIDFRLSSRTNLIAMGQRATGKYDEHETFLGATLAQQLDRREDRGELQLRYALTPLTTFVLRGELGRDRFDSASERDSDTFTLMPGFDLKPLALISGTVFVGYRDFRPLTATIPEYRGLVAKVQAMYVRNATRFELMVDRDLAYSYAVTRPYYALLDTGLTVTHRFPGAWELVARGSRQTLDYQEVLSEVGSTDGPTDRGYVYGGGLGYRLGETLRLGVDVNHSTRRSEVEGRRDFDGTRVFGSISYGKRQ